MEDAPETISVFANADIAVLRSGKAKKNDPPIPADLAPISGSGKRVRKEKLSDDPVLLEPIRFRYSTEKVVDEPETVEDAAETAAEEAKENTEGKSRSRRRRRNKKTELTPETAPKEQPKQETKQEQPVPESDESDAGEEAAKKSNRRRNHYRRRKSKAPKGE
jgi:hypothetical protein